MPYTVKTLTGSQSRVLVSESTSCKSHLYFELSQGCHDLQGIGGHRVGGKAKEGDDPSHPTDSRRR